jgi:hypothetical protein
LQRCQEPESVIALLRVMANTPYGSWPGCEHFGLRELLEQGAGRPEKVRLAVDEMNRALDDLGISNFLVEGISCETPATEEVKRWVVTLASRTERTKTYSFEWSNSSR